MHGFSITVDARIAQFEGALTTWSEHGCRFLSGLAAVEGVALLKSFYHLGNPRTTTTHAPTKKPRVRGHIIGHARNNM